MVYETDPSLDEDLREWGCGIEALAHFNPNMSDEELNAVAEIAHSRNIIDAQDTVLDWQALVDLFGFPLKYRNEHSPADTIVDPDTMWPVAEWKLDAMTHFVVMDGKGVSRDNVSYDPIEGGSKTVREGAFDSYRLFDRTDLRRA
jgi:hypothetical protein